MRISAHPPITLRRQIGQFRHESAIGIEELLGLITLHPAFEQLDMIGMFGINQKRHLVCAERALDLQSIDELRS